MFEYIYYYLFIYLFILNSKICLIFFRTTKTGGLPNLSYVMRKLKSLRTEFITIVDGLTGVML